jgi:cation diffusion facilitator family transporter
MIIIAAIGIIWAAIDKWVHGLRLQNLGAGTLFVLAAAVTNALLGWYLVRTGRRNHSLILEANGKHVLTDSWTSFGVVGGLVLVLLTGWKPFDPLFAIAVAVNIVWSGGHLVWCSAQGLMDYSDPNTDRKLREKLDQKRRRTTTSCIATSTTPITPIDASTLTSIRSDRVLS